MDNIYLCGFMGTGKTVVGVSLSKKLELDFLDTDKMIVRKHKMPIPEIFEKLGEPAFRQFEFEILPDTNKEKPAVVSTGGGLAVNPKNVEELKKYGKLVYLNTPFEVCYKRISGDKKRPVAVNNTKEGVLALYNTRHEFYKKACDIEIHCEGIVSKIAEDIIEALKNQD